MAGVMKEVMDSMEVADVMDEVMDGMEVVG